MQKKNGFTLVEILAVIVILGIIMIIAVPAVSRYILKTDKSVYASNVSAYVETIRGKYEMKDYGNYLKDNEIMVVPLKHIILEKGDNKSSPYGDYDFNRSYVLIVPERNGYSFYAFVIDSTKTGFINVAANKLSEDAIREGIDDDLPLLDSYTLATATYTYKEKTYRRSDVRSIIDEDITTEEKVYVFKEI